MKRIAFAFSIAALVALTAGSQSTSGQGGGNPFIGHSDTGETIHILPPPAAVRAPEDREPIIAPPRPGLSTYRASYGSGNLRNHGGHEIPNAGFFAIFWNNSVSDAGGSGVTSLGYPNIASQIAAFAASYADGRNYSQADQMADFTIVQQYGTADPISSLALAPRINQLGYLVDSQATQPTISDSQIQTYLAGLFNAATIPADTSIIYGVYFPAGMQVTLGSSASCTSFCGYHGNFNYNGQDIKYAAFPYANCSGCLLSGFSVADMLTIVSSHEIREAVTDADGTAWFDNAGYEADDKCAWHHLYQTVNGGFWVQPEYSNGGTVTASGFTATYPRQSPAQGACVVAR